MTVTDHERAALLAAAPSHLRLFVLLCADLAIRSGTVTKLAPQHYDPAAEQLTFVTKLGEKLTLPVTAEVAIALNACDLSNPEPFIRQLWRLQPGNAHPQQGTATTRSQHLTLLAAFARLRKSIGIDRHITPHDLRRTAAVAMYRHTHNLRAVQALLGHRSLPATVWYLDHDMEPVSRTALEAIKKPFLLRKEPAA